MTVLSSACSRFSSSIHALEAFHGDGSSTLELLESLPAGSTLVSVDPCREVDPKAFARLCRGSSRYVSGEVRLLPVYGEVSRAVSRLEAPPWLSLVVWGGGDWPREVEDFWAGVAPLLSPEFCVLVLPDSCRVLWELVCRFGFSTALGESGGLMVSERRLVRTGADGVPRDGLAGEVEDG